MIRNFKCESVWSQGHTLFWKKKRISLFSFLFCLSLIYFFTLGFCFSFCSLKGEGGVSWPTHPPTHFQERNGDWKPNISWVWPQVALGMKRIFKKAFNSHEWQGQNFSLQCHYNIGQTSDENKEKYQLANYKLIQYQILSTSTMGIIWMMVRRIINET